MKKMVLLSTGLLFLMLNQQLVLPKQENPKVIFAVIGEGKMIEPIARLENGTLVPAYNGEGGIEFAEFARLYYNPGTVYNIVTGGKITGKTTVIKNDPSSDCASAMAEVRSSSPLLPLKGNEKTLATDIKPMKNITGTRRNANATEKASIEKLVRAAFNKKTILTNNLRPMKLTVLDVDNDKIPEITGTYICTPRLKERAVLFFIAAKNKAGAYTFQYRDIQEFREDEIMSQDITAIDEGIYTEKLLDILDTENSGVAKIFTMTLSFEGAGFTIYKRNGSVWDKELEVSNYHCGY